MSHVRRNTAHERATAWVDFNGADAGQPTERFPDRRLTKPRPRGEFALGGKPIAWAKHSSPDQIEDALHRQVTDVGSLDRFKILAWLL